MERRKMTESATKRAIVTFVSGLNYDAVVTHAQLASAGGGLEPRSDRYFSLVTRAKKVLLREFSIELEALPVVGYRLVRPGEFNGRSYRRLRFGSRHTHAAGRILMAAPQALLSDKENRKNADALAKIGTIRSMQLSALRNAPKTPSVWKRPDMPRLFSIPRKTGDREDAATDD